MEFLHYKAGDFRSEWRTGQEYVQADYLDPWWQIVVGYPGITEQEISDITRGPLRLGFVRINDSLFFLLKAGNNPWFDAPYEPRFKMNQLDYQTNIPEGKGAAHAHLRGGYCKWGTKRDAGNLTRPPTV